MAHGLRGHQSGRGGREHGLVTPGNVANCVDARLTGLTVGVGQQVPGRRDPESERLNQPGLTLSRPYDQRSEPERVTGTEPDGDLVGLRTADDRGRMPVVDGDAVSGHRVV